MFQIQHAVLVEIHKHNFDPHTAIIGQALLAASRANAKVLMISHACAQGHLQFAVRHSDKLQVLQELRETFDSCPSITITLREVTLVKSEDEGALLAHLASVQVEVVATAKEFGTNQYVVAEVWNKFAPIDV